MAAVPQENVFLMQATDVEFAEQGCGCFSSTFSLFNTDIDRVHLLPNRPEKKDSWVVKQVKKLREVSELVAGPKWKNFIRKIGVYFNNNNKIRKDLQYDSFNYTLNFDDGIHHDDHQDGNLGFSSRFAPPVLLNNDRGATSYS
ncbi:unnamed protein product [Amaranthus hypochondriacus]